MGNPGLIYWLEQAASKLVSNGLCCMLNAVLVDAVVMQQLQQGK